MRATAETSAEGTRALSRMVNYLVGPRAEMTNARWFPAPLALLALMHLPVAPAPARQAPGYAEITQPSPGSPVEGIVTIRGSANHPSFASYDLSFAYAQDTTGTWFPIGSPATVPVVDGALGLWDTTPISPGRYILRLRVFLSTGAVLESQVRDLPVGLPVPVASAGPASPTSQLAIATSTPIPAREASPQQQPPQARNPVRAALGIGGAMAAAGLLLFGAFVGLQRALSVWLGGLRMRRVLRAPNRSRLQRR